MSAFFQNRRVVVTGGAGFLGRYVTEKLQKRGCKNILVPKIEDYDLVSIDDIKRMYEDMKPDIVIHLAAVVGGIGANREHPGEFFYKNLMMGVQTATRKRPTRLTVWLKKCCWSSRSLTAPSMVLIRYFCFRSIYTAPVTISIRPAVT